MKEQSKKIGKVIPILLVSSLMLSGCFGGGDTKSEKEESFSDTNIYSKAEYKDLLKLEEKLEKQGEEAIKASDYTIQNVLLKDLDRNFYYEGILSMDTDTIYQQQLKYFQVHREYMVLLEKSGADKDTLIHQNRIFNQYINTLSGRSIEGKSHVKRAQLRVFERYSILELNTILNGKENGLAQLLKDETAREKKVKMWEWFQTEKNANYSGDILVHTKLKFDLLEPGDQDSTTELSKIVHDTMKVTDKLDKSNTAHTEAALVKAEKAIKELHFTESATWLPKLALDYLAYEHKKVKVYKSGNEFAIADSNFFHEAGYQDALVSISHWDAELAKQSEKRKAKKEEMSKK